MKARVFAQLGAVASLVFVLAACATRAEPLPQIESWLEAGGAPPPAQRMCPYVADVNLRALVRQQADPVQIAQRAQWQPLIQTMLDEITIPASSPHRPAPDAPIVLRAVSPPGGGHSNTLWSVVWRDAEGVWWFWKQNRNTAAPPPPPPPPGTAEYTDYMARNPNGIPPDDVRWPPESGRLHADLAAALDGALNNPCRAWEPDIWPANTPLTRNSRQPPPPPPHDWSPTYVELREPGRTRQIAAALHRDSLQEVLVDVAAYPR